LSRKESFCPSDRELRKITVGLTVSNKKSIEKRMLKSNFASHAEEIWIGSPRFGVSQRKICLASSSTMSGVSVLTDTPDM
jgi:hypothetical protein